MDDEALFDDDLTALPAEAVAACAAAFAMVAADAAAEEERDLGIALREPEVDILERPPQRTEGYRRAWILRLFDPDSDGVKVLKELGASKKPFATRG